MSSDIKEVVVRRIAEALVDGAQKTKGLGAGVSSPGTSSKTHKSETEGIDKPTDKPDTPNKPNTPNTSNNQGDGQQPRDEKGWFTTDPNKPPGDSTYVRPSGWRAGMRDAVWNAAEIDGKVRDPEADDILVDKDNWIMGHAPGYEFRHHQRSAQERGISRQEFLDEYYGMIDHLRPETPSTSSSHAHETGWSAYKGPGSPGYGGYTAPSGHN